jgi:high frequency lysogenization protein
MISGEQPYLDNEHNASKVRALLLAGIRSAVLWRQCGGSRWQILLGRKKYVIACDRLLAEI